MGQDTNTKDNLLIFSINHTLQMPSGNMADRFGYNSNISGSLLYKTNNNFIFTLETGFIFGSNVKEDDLFSSIDGNNGVLISQNGEIPTIRLFERGGNIDFSIGRYIKLPFKRSKSGLVYSIGIGYLYHKIFIETLTVELPQLNNDLLKGYDRLCGGLQTKQFFGYMHMSKKNLIRYIVGVEFVQAFTKDLREYNYTTQSLADENRKDLLFGFKTGFVIPIKERKTGRYYIN